MTIAISDYMPVLKWRQGEYQALLRLHESSKSNIVPLLVIPPVEYDFEAECMKKTVQEHISPFVKRYSSKWGKRPSIIDIHDSLESEVMDDGNRVVPHIFLELYKNECTAIPAINFSRPIHFKNDIKAIIARDKKGLAVRVNLIELLNPNFNINVNALLSFMGIGYEDLDLIIDLGEPENYLPYITFSNLLANAITNINHLPAYRSYVLTSMSLKMNEIKKPGDEVPRHEWLLYKHLISVLGDVRLASYGDYTIESPKFISLDMRMLKPAGKIIYTCDDSWYIPKGKAFRGNEQQMTKHCESIINSGNYSGSGFSYGDQLISDTFNGSKGCGNLSTWKQVAVSHHLEKVVEQLANYHASRIVL